MTVAGGTLHFVNMASLSEQAVCDYIQPQHNISFYSGQELPLQLFVLWVLFHPTYLVAVCVGHGSLVWFSEGKLVYMWLSKAFHLTMTHTAVLTVVQVC